MCVEPQTMKDGLMIACRKCWQCQKDRIEDKVGRCLAEQFTASRTLAVTLTYSDEYLKEQGEESHAVTLVYSDVQKFLKRLRFAGFNVRYIVAGEYGSKKGRAHWHAVLFFYGKSPEIELEKRIEWKYWPAGYSYFQEAEFDGFRYLMKYAVKGDATKQAHIAMSKRPPLGFNYFIERARAYVEAGLSPKNSIYQFRGVTDGNGKLRKFRLQGRMREIFIEEFERCWLEKYGTLPPYSEFVESQLDKVAKRNTIIETDEEWQKRMMLARRYSLPSRIETGDWNGPEEYLCCGVGWLTITDGRCEYLEKGKTVWQVSDIESADARLSVLGLPTVEQLRERNRRDW